jgi:hypothetical protein
MSGICNRHEKKRNACKILIVKPKGKRPLARSKQRLEDGPNIETDWKTALILKPTYGVSVWTGFI